MCCRVRSYVSPSFAAVPYAAGRYGDARIRSKSAKRACAPELGREIATALEVFLGGAKVSMARVSNGSTPGTVCKCRDVAACLDSVRSGRRFGAFLSIMKTCSYRAADVGGMARHSQRCRRAWAPVRGCKSEPGMPMLIAPSFAAVKTLRREQMILEQRVEHTQRCQHARLVGQPGQAEIDDVSRRVRSVGSAVISSLEDNNLQTELDARGRQLSTVDRRHGTDCSR